MGRATKTESDAVKNKWQEGEQGEQSQRNFKTVISGAAYLEEEEGDEIEAGAADDLETEEGVDGPVDKAGDGFGGRRTG